MPPAVYDHLPYLAITGQDDVFYRCEPFSTSRRVPPSSAGITPRTFAAPISELPFMTTGFFILGRYAIPGSYRRVTAGKFNPRPEPR